MSIVSMYCEQHHYKPKVYRPILNTDCWQSFSCKLLNVEMYYDSANCKNEIGAWH